MPLLIDCVQKKVTGHGKHPVPIGMYKTLLTIRYITNPKWCAHSSITGIMVDKWFWKLFGCLSRKFSQKLKKICPPQRAVFPFFFYSREHSQRTGLVRVVGNDRGLENFDLTLTQYNVRFTQLFVAANTEFHEFPSISHFLHCLSPKTESTSCFVVFFFAYALGCKSTGFLQI